MRCQDQQGGYLACPGGGAERKNNGDNAGADPKSRYRDRIKE